ncbi:chromosome condensation regulator RCC1 [Carpediemonas membranifera]|uniref:Chromosome condensation regulator RCC1 n=1 Tax=Carpediemonas membranifera TaxID=201153 RepID=A0A8J6AZ49_9EUKA|nr:chromosome condensation regulator RCC1 [Carpediemonas membranifera]|eukprot:KAG9389507.1 chromosome condensation regulator RCC1 [Carpediemonas membranifera]
MDTQRSKLEHAVAHATHLTKHLPGDIPALLQNACKVESHEWGFVMELVSTAIERISNLKVHSGHGGADLLVEAHMSLIRAHNLLQDALDIEVEVTDTSDTDKVDLDAEMTVADLADDLDNITLSDPYASRLIAKACAIITEGPELSMNIHLEDGEELPERLHTLLQGTVWATLMQAGADPDLEDKEDEEADDETFFKNYENEDDEITGKDAKCMWFLCRKFWFSHHVAENDGETKFERTAINLASADVWQIPHVYYRHYAGRLFTRGENTDNETGVMSDAPVIPAYSRVRVPPVLRLFSAGNVAIVTTPMGMFGWGKNFPRCLGLGDINREPPTRITFPDAPMVAEYERSLPCWRKNELVLDIFSGYGETMIVTAAGIVAAGDNQLCRLGVDSDEEALLFFTPVPVPRKFRPYAAFFGDYHSALQMNKRLLVVGRNGHGRLGLGHTEHVRVFTEVPFDVDNVWWLVNATVFVSGSKLIYAGRVTDVSQKYLPNVRSGDLCLSPTPLRLSAPVKAAALNKLMWCFVKADGTGCFGVGPSGDEWELDMEIISVKTLGWCFWFETSEGWYGLGNNSFQMIGVDGPDDIISPVMIEWETKEFGDAEPVQISAC